MVREAAANGAQIILLPELFERQYFCQERNYDYYAFATPVDENPAVKHFQKVAAELQVVLPISFYERDINVFYNTVAVIDADGSVFGIYRKHIFLMTIIIRKSSISHREIQALRCGIQICENWSRNMLGSVVSRDSQRNGGTGSRNPFLSDSDWLRADS